MRNEWYAPTIIHVFRLAFWSPCLTELTTFSGFNLSVGCFGPTLSKIAPNGQIREFTGSRMDHSAPNYVASLFISKKWRKMTIWSNKSQKCWFSWKNLWEATCLTPNLEKKKSSNNIHSKLIDLIIYNHFEWISIQNHIFFE